MNNLIAAPLSAHKANGIFGFHIVFGRHRVFLSGFRRTKAEPPQKFNIHR
jgi:hypothetical protein